jgi:hypothetical protein
MNLIANATVPFSKQASNTSWPFGGHSSGARTLPIDVVLVIIAHHHHRGVLLPLTVTRPSYRLKTRMTASACCPRLLLPQPPSAVSAAMTC